MRLSHRIALAVALASSHVACTPAAEREPIPGVRLGMSPRDVRERFEGGADGAWQTKLGGGAGATDDTVIEWSAVGVKTRASHARFEFHLGMLVAVRVHLRDPAPPRARIDTTPKTVTLWSPATPSEGGTDVTILARDCPTHHDEAEALVVKLR
jgi:hypothetical protein